jgi:hypothetical protein
MTKAERLDEMTFPFGPTFPLDEDIVANLAPYPGELPRSAAHYRRLLPKPELNAEAQAILDDYNRRRTMKGPPHATEEDHS